ncbi:MAG TPA: nucleoside diphosphate kinase regulator [Povalibacter sp.]|uniref:nucleoside diphosphate kinase regulator n=1 Tax=Povalibacter sp. TaxID=1962978 RepID=UPI002C2A6C66|nr:nucleoside diphosphate kinase regulator [Povalibacter sp.]HMN43011.1 nucleoside diphosphate kinase regulator [Povalibacter sp.]
MSQRIILSKTDVARLRSIISEQSRSAIRDLDHLAALGEEIDHAKIVDPQALPEDAVTLNSIVRVMDTQTRATEEYTLVSPSQADVTSRRLSVTAPLGVALLGFREGDEVIWEMPGGERRLKVLQVVQPPPDGTVVFLPPAA